MPDASKTFNLAMNQKLSQEMITQAFYRKESASIKPTYDLVKDDCQLMSERLPILQEFWKSNTDEHQVVLEQRMAFTELSTKLLDMQDEFVAKDKQYKQRKLEIDI